MKRHICLCSLALLTASISMANDDSMDTARKLIQVMDVTKYMDQSFTQVEGFAEQMIAAQTDLTPEQMAEARTAAKESMAMTMDAMKTIDWEGVFADIYGVVFTIEEMQATLDLYTSEIGQKMLAQQPELMTATVQRMQGEMKKIMPKLQADIEQAVQNAKGREEPTPPPVPAHIE